MANAREPRSPKNNSADFVRDWLESVKHLADKATEAAAAKSVYPLPTVVTPSPTQVKDIVEKIMLTADQLRDDEYGSRNRCRGATSSERQSTAGSRSST